MGMVVSLNQQGFFFQQDHCKEAYESEQQHQHEPPELRSNED